MKKKRTILFGSFLALLLLFAGALIWIRLSALQVKNGFPMAMKS